MKDTSWVRCPFCKMPGTPLPEEDPVRCGNCGEGFSRKHHTLTEDDLDNMRLLEDVSRVVHEVWAHWTRHLLEMLGLTGVSTKRLSKLAYERNNNHVMENGSPVQVTVGGTAWFPESLEAIDRWRRQIETPYDELSNSEQASDREQAHKLIAAMLPFLTRKMQQAGVEAIARAAMYLPADWVVKDGKIDLSLGAQLARDRLLYGNSFELDGERIDPKHVVLHEDGTYEIREVP